MRAAAGRAEEGEMEAQVEADATRAMRVAVRGELEDRVRTIMDKELAPIVREAITEDVQRSIAALLALTPAAVTAIMEDLTQTQSYDRRQKAYTLLMKYTAGHPKLIQDVDPTPPAVTVVFEGMPRPEYVEAVGGFSEDQFECNACGELKPEIERSVPGADRCTDCHAALQDRYKELTQGLKPDD